MVDGTRPIERLGTSGMADHSQRVPLSMIRATWNDAVIAESDRTKVVKDHVAFWQGVEVRAVRSAAGS